MRSALEVWGDPIAHSLSPTLHTAAYAHLGWDWTYGRRRVDEAAFAAELADAARTLRGLSLTMPLKTAARAAAGGAVDDRARDTGAVNTLVFADGGLRGFNTDVGGIVRALADEGVRDLDRARIVGAGATATSALVALAELGARDVEVVARRPETVGPLVEVGGRRGMTVTAAPFGAPVDARPLTIATLPGDIRLPDGAAETLADSGGLLFDVVYGHWPTALAAAWTRASAPAVSGTGMLLHQAVLQIRAFATGGVDEPLPDEEGLVAVMRRALVGD